MRFKLSDGDKEDLEVLEEFEDKYKLASHWVQ